MNVRVRVRFKDHWRNVEVVVPDEFNFPSSRINKMDAMHEWVRQHFSDKDDTRRVFSPSQFYISHIDDVTIFRP